MVEGLFNVEENGGVLHHAYLIVGEPRSTTELVRQFLVGKGFVSPGPNLLSLEIDHFGIDDSRVLKEWQTKRPYSGERQFLILSLNFITVEAQNALLKTLEEPTASSHFFIIARKEEILLPTIRSRCKVVHAAKLAIDPAVEKLALDFLKAEPAKRLKIVADLLGEEVNKQEVINFLNVIEIILARELKANSLKLEAISGLAKARSYLYDRSPAPRLILEHLAFALPQV